MTKPTTVYLAGPMAGRPEFNYPAFNEAEKVLKAKRIRVINPASLDGEDIPEGVDPTAIESGNVDPRSRAAFLKRDLLHIINECDGIVMLPGWIDSKGANVELVVAMSLGLRTFEYRGDGFPKDPLQEILMQPNHGKLVEHWWSLYS